MSKRAWWLSAAALLLLLPVGALGIAVTLLDPNHYKPQIVAAVQQATGRPLSLGGPLRISRSLWPTIEITDVTLANLPGGTRPDLARAERIVAQLSLPAPLRRRIEVSKLTLEGPNILFEFVGGKPNWILEPSAVTQSSLSRSRLSRWRLRSRSLLRVGGFD
jgi:AsmA protein